MDSKTQLFNSWGVIKWAYFQKKWSVPLSAYSPVAFGPLDMNDTSNCVVSWCAITFFMKLDFLGDKMGEKTL